VNYGALAPLYDRIMAHVGYHQWFSLVNHVAETYGRSPNATILELGAGTGVLGELCAEAGFAYTGSDLSTFMCRQASRQRRLPFICADAKHLPLKRNTRFDMILFLYDGINYLMTAQDYRMVFSEVHEHLSSGGLFLFDITTLFNSQTNFNEYVDADDLGDSFYFRHSYYDSLSGIQHNDFTIFNQSTLVPQLYEKSLEHHCQKVFSVGEIRGFIPDSLFETLGVWDNFSLKKYSSRSERVHFLLRKKDAA
jgi:SAM-dependent methyltransferase